MNSDTQSIIEKLKEASAGLLYISESEYPFEVIYLGSENEQAPDNHRAQPAPGGTSGEHTAERSLASVPPAPEQEVTLDWFFRNHVKDQEWHGIMELETANRFRQFKQLIVDNLKNIKVLRRGEPEVHIRIVGQTPSGEAIAIMTKAIET